MTIQFFAVGQEATGIIAVGQLATGVIAIGQGATGFIAIGQMARGVIAIGMLSVGIVSVGMLSFGLAYSVGMIGAGGMRGGGLILPLVPILPKRPKLPVLSTLAQVHQGQAGWLAGIIEQAGRGFALKSEGHILQLDVPAGLLEGVGTAASEQIAVVAMLERQSDGVLALRRLMRAGGAAFTPEWFAIAAAQLLGLAIGAYLYFQYVVVDLIDMLLVFHRGMG